MFKLASFVLSALLATSALGNPLSQSGRTCGNLPTDEEVVTMEQKFQSLQTKVQSFKQNKATDTYTLNVYFNVISQDTTYAGGTIPDSVIQKQMTVLNQAYNETSIVWQLAGVTRVTNADWFKNAGPNTAQQSAMKQALRQGGAADLNVYSVSLSTTDLLGYATFPAQYEDNPTDDGVVIRFTTLPGGQPPYDLGQ
ncbi:hypothetical protein H0H92_014081, partial [Tricholoma furcatifolium]